MNMPVWGLFDNLKVWYFSKLW